MAGHCGAFQYGAPIAGTYLAATRPDEVRRLIANALCLAAAQTVVLAAIAGPILWVSVHRYGDIVAVGLAFVAVYVPFNLLYRYLNFINQGLHKFGTFNAARMALPASYLIAVIGMYVFHIPDLRVALGAYALSHVFAALVAWTGLRAAASRNRL